MMKNKFMSTVCEMNSGEPRSTGRFGEEERRIECDIFPQVCKRKSTRHLKLYILAEY